MSVDAVERDGGVYVDLIIRGRVWNAGEGPWTADEDECGTFARRYQMGAAGPGESLTPIEAAPAERLALPDRELRFRLAQLQPYDRRECARELGAPLQELLDAPAHDEVGLLFEWARVNGRLEDLRASLERAVHGTPDVGLGG